MGQTAGLVGARAGWVNLLKQAASGYAPGLAATGAECMIRDEIKAALITAMKARDATTTGAIRLIQSAIKNRDIELRTATTQPDDDTLVREVLQKMMKQRRESIEMFEQGGRQELADVEKSELTVIEGFLPAQMDEAAAKAAIAGIIAETEAASIKDMGRVMAAVKARHAADMDMAKASGWVKAALSA